MSVHSVLEPLIQRKIFQDEETAIRELTRDYVLRQIEVLQAGVTAYQHKYRMSFSQFDAYLKQRSAQLAETTLSVEQRQKIVQAVMAEEDDWLDWKASQELLESWLGLNQEIRG